MPGNRARRLVQRSSITPPSRGSATRERGRLARNLISWRRSRSVATTLRAGSRPFGVKRNGKSQGNPRRPCRSVPVAETGEAVPGYGAGGTPAVPGGHPPHFEPDTSFTSCPGIGCQWASKMAGLWAPKVAGSERCPTEGAERPEWGSGPGSRPFGVKRNGKSQRNPRRPCRSVPVADTGEAVPGYGAGGTPAVPGGHPPYIEPDT